VVNREGRRRPPLTGEELARDWVLYQEHLARGGDMSTAAAEAGLSRSAFQQHIAKYRELAGIKVQYRTRRSVTETFIKQQNADLESRIDRMMDRYYQELIQRIETLEVAIQRTRPVGPAFIPSHRRVADGGLPINQQRKAFKRKMAS